LKTLHDETNGIYVGSRELFLEMGFQDFVRKPIDPLIAIGAEAIAAEALRP
jgi:hypothetical protein